QDSVLASARCVTYASAADDAVEVQNVSHDRVHLRRLQKTGLIKGHRAIDVVPQGRSIGPEASHRLERPRGSKRTLSAHEDRPHISFSLWPVTPGTLSGEHFSSCRDRPRAFRQTAAVG